MSTAVTVPAGPLAAYFYKPNPDILTNGACNDFINDVEAELRAGYGFVPFIGAGFSAPSGAPLTPDIKTYLQRCIALALGVEESGMRRWNPRSDQWPPFTDRSRSSKRDDFWFGAVQRDFQRRRETTVADPETSIVQEAVGAMAEWRSALQFLSRLTFDRRGTDSESRRHLALDHPDQEIIDAALREILKGKQPTLGHRMLAHLAGLLRLDLILTTNFDDLLEQAFASFRNPLTVFDLQLGSTLPSWSALSTQRSLVKLHGARTSLRADYTLDAAPSQLDCWRFVEYFLSPLGRHQLANRLHLRTTIGRLPLRNQLLVMGMSATERRTRVLIEYAWQYLGPDFKVWWLCHSMDDVRTIQRFTTDFIARHPEVIADDQMEPRKQHRVSQVTNPHVLSTERGSWARSRIFRHSHLDLLFLQLYQTMRRGLPVAGIVFPSVSRLALPPLPSDLTAEQSVTAAQKPSRAYRYGQYRDSLRAQLRNKVLEIRRDGEQSYKLVVVTAAPAKRGITTVCGEVCDSLSATGDICIWLDMNDISSTDDLFEKLLDAAYYRLGIENWMPIFVANLPRSRATEIRRLADSTNRQWVLFLNARERPGANTEDRDRATLADYHERPNGWLDGDRPQHERIATKSIKTTPTPESDESNTPEAFMQLLGELCGPQSPRISVVLLCRESHRRSTPQGEGAIEMRPTISEQLVNAGLPCAVLRPQGNCIAFDEKQTVRKALRWALMSPQRLRFLHALTLMQRTRYLATIWSDAVSLSSPHPTGRFPIDHTREWLTALERTGLLRRKAGGFIWMHTLARHRLRELLANRRSRQMLLPPASQKLIRALQTLRPEKNEPHIHDELAQLYRRILTASEAPAAVFAAMHHGCRAAEATLRCQKGDNLMEAAVGRIEGATAVLLTHYFLIQTSEYSRGSCRRLEYVRDSLTRSIDEAALDAVAKGRARFPNAIARRAQMRALRRATTTLRLKCTEVMRAIAREVGEDGKAYLRHRQVRAILVGHPAADANDKTIKAETLFRALFRPGRNRLKASGGFDPTIEWLRYWKWNGMLGIASRSYKAARQGLANAILSITDFADLSRQAPYPLRSRASRSDKALAAKLAFFTRHLALREPKAFGQQTSDPQRLVIEVLRVVEQFVACRLQSHSVERRLTLVSRGALSDHSSTTMDMVRLGGRLADHVVGQDHSADARNTVAAMFSKSRLMMHRSICSTMQDDWAGAMRDLADAEACLNYSDPRRRGTDRAVVELYRAEVRLREAAATTITIRDHKNKARVIRFDRLPMEPAFRTNEADALLWNIAGKAKYATLPAPNVGTALSGTKVVAALVQDALRFLTRAEVILLSRRRNVWWTSWFFQRKLTAISMAVWATVGEIGTPIPFFGLEAAPRKTPTEADTLLDEARRMIRVDAYRFATIIEAYASCAKALHFRLMLDQQAYRLPERQRAMHGNLQDALSELVEVTVARKDMLLSRNARLGATGSSEESWPFKKKAEMDTDVLAYIERVTLDCDRVASDLANPLWGAVSSPSVGNSDKVNLQLPRT